MKKIWMLAAFMIFASGVSAGTGAGSITGQARYYDEVLVTYKQQFSADDISTFTQKHIVKSTDRQSLIREIETFYNLTAARTYLTPAPFSCYKIPDISKMAEMTAALKNESIISAAQPNYKLYALAYNYIPLSGGPNDTYYQNKDQWGFWQVRADKVYISGLISTGSTYKVIVAVVDTGILSTHVDLSGTTVNGHNVLNPSAHPVDDNGHGTHVSSVIAANTDNGMGIAGAACNKVLIMPIKALDSTGSGSDADIYTAVVWAADNGANVINLSLGGADADAVLQEAVNYAYVNGCVVVAAAGNDSKKAYYPAAYSNVISVAATDITSDVYGNTMDTFATFSNYGKIDVSAPGVDIAGCDNTGGYSTMNGTSFSAPFVSALAGLIKLKYPSLNPDGIRDVITRSCDDAGSSGYDDKFGWGRINFYRALNKDYNTVSGGNSIKTFNWPNPFSPNKDMLTNITFLPQEASNVTVSIYDGGGTLVWKSDIAASDVTANVYNTVKWDGMNLDGKYVANGTYFFIVKGKSGRYGKNKISVLY
jgi:subtilisin family serine protease